MIRPQLLVSAFASLIIFIGVLGIHVDSKEPIIGYPPSTGNTTTRLKVVEGRGQPTSSATTSLQGTGSLQQGQSTPLQTPIGDQLQPNAGANNLPKNY